MGTREELEAALAEAEAELGKAVVGRATAAVEVNADLEKARAHCRQARVALTELNRAEPAAKPAKPTQRSNQAAEKPSKAPTVRPRKTVRGLASIFFPRHSGSKNPSRQLLIRQGLMLLALVLAYLQYYFFDVNLQVARLPSITVLLFG